MWPRNRKTNRARALVPTALLLGGLAFGVGLAAADEGEQTVPDGQNKGFTLGLGWGATNLHVSLDGRELLTPEQRVYEHWGNGPEIIMGVGFGPRFRLEFTALISEHTGDNPEYNVYSGGMRAEGIISFRTGSRLQPEFIAGMGFGGLMYEHEDRTDYIYGWGQGNLGPGLRWRLNRHWTLDGQYIYSILDVERELSGDHPEDDDYSRFVGGEGHSQRLGLRLVYDF